VVPRLDAERHAVELADVAAAFLRRAGFKPTEIFVGQAERLASIGLSGLDALAVVRAPVDTLASVVARLADRVDGRVPTATMEEIGEIIRLAVPNFHHIDGEAQLDDRL
jgi:hypothetical protein